MKTLDYLIINAGLLLVKAIRVTYETTDVITCSLVAINGNLLDALRRRLERL